MQGLPGSKCPPLEGEDIINNYFCKRDPGPNPISQTGMEGIWTRLLSAGLLPSPLTQDTPTGGTPPVAGMLAQPASLMSDSPCRWGWRGPGTWLCSAWSHQHLQEDPRCGSSLLIRLWKRHDQLRGPQGQAPLLKLASQDSGVEMAVGDSSPATSLDFLSLNFEPLGNS